MSVGLTLAPKGSTPPRGVHIRRHTTDDDDDRSVGPTARRHTVKEHVGFASPRSSAAPLEQFRSCAPSRRMSVVVVVVVRFVSFLASRVRRVVVFSTVAQTILIFWPCGECASAVSIEKPISVQEKYYNFDTQQISCPSFFFWIITRWRIDRRNVENSPKRYVKIILFLFLVFFHRSSWVEF